MLRNGIKERGRHNVISKESFHKGINYYGRYLLAYFGIVGKLKIKLHLIPL